MKKRLCILLAALLLSGCIAEEIPEEESRPEMTTASATVTTVPVSTSKTMTTASEGSVSATSDAVTSAPTELSPSTQTVTETTFATTVVTRPAVTVTDVIIPDGRLYIDGKQVGGVTEDGFHYIVYHPKFHGVQSDENWALITRYSGDVAGRLVVPDEIAGYPVYKVIVDPTNSRFKQLVLPDTVQILEMPSLAEAAQLTDVWLPESCTFTFSCTPVSCEEGWLIPRCAPTVHIGKNSTAERLSVALDEYDNVPFASLFSHEPGKTETFDLSQYDLSGHYGVEDEPIRDVQTGELVPHRMSGYISFE